MAQPMFSQLTAILSFLGGNTEIHLYFGADLISVISV